MAEGHRHQAIAGLICAAEDFTSSLDLDQILKRVAERVRQDVAYDTFAVLLGDELGQFLSFRFVRGFPADQVQGWRFGPGQGIVGTVFASARPLLVPDVAEEPRYIEAGMALRSELAVPLIVNNQVIGVLDLGHTQPGKFDQHDAQMITQLAGHLANAIANARLCQDLREQARTLALLHEVNRELAATLDHEQLLTKVAQVVKRLVDYQLFVIMLWDEQTQLLDLAFSLRFDDRMCCKQGMPLGYGICGTAAALRQPVRVANVRLDPRYVACGQQVDVASELAVPLFFKNRLIGVIDLESVEPNAFTDQHEQMLSALSSYIAIAIVNARLYERVRQNERRLESDLSAARKIQKGLLPAVAPQVPGLEIAFTYRPARQLGGDFYDFLSSGDGTLAVAVGDVAGKGSAAAFFGSLAIGILRGNVVQQCCGPAAMLAQLNRPLRANRTDKRFVAMAFGVYDPLLARLQVAAAGFPWPVLVRDGSAEEIPLGGVPLGTLADPTYVQETITLAPGDVVVFYSDGIYEAMNACDEELGVDRIRSLVAELADCSAQEIAETLADAAEHHTGPNGHQPDDRTVVVLRSVAGPSTPSGPPATNLESSAREVGAGLRK